MSTRRARPWSSGAADDSRAGAAARGRRCGYRDPAGAARRTRARRAEGPPRPADPGPARRLPAPRWRAPSSPAARPRALGPGPPVRAVPRLRRGGRAPRAPAPLEPSRLLRLALPRREPDGRLLALSARRLRLARPGGDRLDAAREGARGGLRRLPLLPAGARRGHDRGHDRRLVRPARRLPDPVVE